MNSTMNNYNNIHNICYNYDFICTYKSFDEDYYKKLCYQIQMLQALNINKYDEFVVTKNTENIYYFLKDYYEIDIIILVLKEKYKNSNLAFFINNNIALFQLLFSYNYFDVFHKCLGVYIKDKKTDLIIGKKYFEELRLVIRNDDTI